MIIKELTQVGNPVIRRVSSPVKDARSKKTKQIVKNLVDSMRHANLVGIAAPQIGINKRIFVTEIRETNTRKIHKKSEYDTLRVFINPEITFFSENIVSGYEGCGSVAEAGVFALIPRPDAVLVKAVNEKGESFELRATGLLARVIQHEQDHIDGKVFLDRVTDMTSLMSQSEYRKKFGRKKKK